MFTNQLGLVAHTNSFLLVFSIFLIVLVVLVVFILRWAVKENRMRRERFSAGASSTDRD
jgi:RsiW-degrading membrane proteinase PrsW (M82 family)